MMTMRETLVVKETYIPDVCVGISTDHAHTAVPVTVTGASIRYVYV